MLITTDGLVTRSYPTGDGDQVLHILTPTMGRLAVIVKGGKKKVSGSVAITQLFTWGNYELYHKGDMYWLRGGSVLNSFYELTTDLSAMALGAYFCDITTDLTGEGEQTEGLLRLLLNALYLLERGDKAHALIKGAFELRAMAISGYCPSLENCCVCGEEHPDLCYMDIMNGQLLCADCQTSLNRQRVVDEEARRELLGERRIICPMTASTLAAVRYVLSAPDKKVFSFELTDMEEQRTFARVAETYLLNHLERGFDTLDFYQTVKKEDASRPRLDS